MAYKYSAAHLSALQLSPPDLIYAAAEAGYDYVGLRLIPTTDSEPHHDLTGNPVLMRATKQALAQTGIEVWDCEVIRMDPEHGPDFYEPMMEAAAELGAKHYITQTPDPDIVRVKDRYAKVCEIGKTLGLTMDLEFISWYPETGDVTKAADVVRAADAQNVGMLIDMLQFDRSKSKVADLAVLPPEWFTWCHLCDAPSERPSTVAEMIRQGRSERSFPGEGGLNIRGIMEVLPNDLVCALEIPWDTLAAEVGYPEYLRLALSVTKDFINQ